MSTIPHLISKLSTLRMKLSYTEYGGSVGGSLTPLFDGGPRISFLFEGEATPLTLLSNVLSSVERHTKLTESVIDQFERDGGVEALSLLKEEYASSLRRSHEMRLANHALLIEIKKVLLQSMNDLERHQ
jgi:hypothetical protein